MADKVRSTGLRHTQPELLEDRRQRTHANDGNYQLLSLVSGVMSSPSVKLTSDAETVVLFFRSADFGDTHQLCSTDTELIIRVFVADIRVPTSHGHT